MTTTQEPPEGFDGFASFHAKDESIAEAQLANGLRIVVIPNHRAPVVTHMVWYRNGSADDPVGQSGIAHFLEHLMFKGTSDNPVGRFSAMVSDVGGEENAFTSNDYTAYHQRVPSDHLAMCMRYEADRMKNLVLSDDVVAPERDVVLEERRMRTDSSPGSILNEAVLAALFTSHPYGKPIIGWRHEIERLERRDALDYYERFYTPENAILVVAGDVAAPDVIALAREIYGPIERFGTAPVRRRPREPRPATHRRVTLADEKVGQPFYQRLHLVPSYHTAGPGQAEAFDVLTTLLGTGQTSALFKGLVLREKLAVSVGAFYAGHFLDDSYLGIYAVPTPGVGLDDLERAVETLLDGLARAPFADRDIARAKTRLVAKAVFEQDNPTNLANRYGARLACGASLRDIEEWPDRIEAVGPDNLRDALRSLDFRRCVSGHLDVLPLAAKIAEPA